MHESERNENEKLSGEKGRTKTPKHKTRKNERQHIKGMLFEACVNLTMHVTCNTVSLDQLEPKKGT